MTRTIGIAICLLGWMTSSAHAGAITLNGFFNDSTNPALLASDGYMDLQAARFGNDDEIARNVAVYELTVGTASNFSFVSTGYGIGLGAQPYFTIFSGSGIGATFLDSNSLSDFANIDFSFSRALGAGSYMLAIGVWQNMSFAENNPDADPSLGDGFTALGGPFFLGDSFYEVTISSNNVNDFSTRPAGDIVNQPQPVPEPSSLLLLGAGVATFVARRRAARVRA